MILSAQSIRAREGMVRPFEERTTADTIEYHAGKLGASRLSMTFGLSPAGYDIRVADRVRVGAAGFELASSFERFDMPLDVLARVTDKSSWARRGLCVQNTVIEPGWRGYLTLELTNHSDSSIFIPQGFPIAQVLFELLDEPTDLPYEGKYQDQQSGPQRAR